MEMVKHPYRDRLQLGLVVDSPLAFSAVWRLATPVMPQATCDKIQFVSARDVESHLSSLVGKSAAQILAGTIRKNRTEDRAPPKQMPSEVVIDFDEEEVARSLSRRLSRALS